MFCFLHIAIYVYNNTFHDSSSRLLISQPSRIPVFLYSHFEPSRAYMRAPSNSDVVFLLSQVSHQFLFSPDFRALFSTHSSSSCLLKCVYKINNNLNSSCLQMSCDTCDSKNTKTPVMCAYTRARESG